MIRAGDSFKFEKRCQLVISNNSESQSAPIKVIIKRAGKRALTWDGAPESPSDAPGCP